MSLILHNDAVLSIQLRLCIAERVWITRLPRSILLRRDAYWSHTIVLDAVLGLANTESKGDRVQAQRRDLGDLLASIRLWPKSWRKSISIQCRGWGLHRELGPVVFVTVRRKMENWPHWQHVLDWSSFHRFSTHVDLWQVRASLGVHE